MPGKSANVNVGDTDGTAHAFGVRAADIDEPTAILKSLAPRAAVGLTDEIKKEYFQDPSSVTADPEEGNG